MKLAVIPARGGSKRIPRKNIKEFCGSPMIAWSIRVAEESKVFDRIVVSTDDAEIAAVAREHGAEVPFMRAADLSDDMTPTVPVIAHATGYCIDLGWPIEYACCIYPCSPLIEAQDLVKALEILKRQGVDFVYPVTEYPHPIQRAMKLLPGNKMQFIAPEFELTRTQDLETMYHDAGQFYMGTASAWINNKRMHTAGIGMPIPHWRVADIDTLDDWKRAEALFESTNFRTNKSETTGVDSR